MSYTVGSELQAVMRGLIREGASSRKIAQFTGVAQNTALRYIGMFLDEAPVCAHGRRVYKCLTCTSGRHSPLPERNLPS